MPHSEQALQLIGKANMLKVLLLAGVGTLALASAANACDPSSARTNTSPGPVSGTTYSLGDGGSVVLNSDSTITVTDGGQTVTLPAGSATITMNGDGTVALNGPAPASTPATTTQTATQAASGTTGSSTSPTTQATPSASSSAPKPIAAASPAQATTDPTTAATQSDPGTTGSQAATDPMQTASDPSSTSTQTASADPPAQSSSGAPTSQASGGMTLIGVNISGGEFGRGQVGTNYIYPSQAEVNFYASAGMTVIRMPFLIENVMPNPGTLSQGDVTAMQQVVQWAAADGMDVDLDAHDYGDAWGQEITPGSQIEQQFDNFWAQMASAFKGYPNVIYGIMNEPNQQTPQQQAQIDNDAIQAIRSSGANQEILVPGTSWTGAWTWVSGGNAAAINPSTIQHPDNNWVIEVHQYLDADGSGTNPAPITDPNLGVERLTAVTQWAQQVGAKLFLGEFGAPQDSQSQQAVANMLSYMEQNSSVWQGGTMWGAGAWWGNYFQGIEPPNLQGTTRGLSTLEQFVPKAPGA
jgi:endoglucanase